ncbi:MAG: hypothetical protein M1814_000569 [Vezdaea aestivalis]|nr:MAG: hypothetical protein M1814_000569 [Vezdaea aestivalis]
MSTPGAEVGLQAPVIHTYHHICSQLVLATTYKIADLPVRASPGLDKASILPLPRPPKISDSDEQSDEEDSTTQKRSETSSDCSLLLSTIHDKKAMVVRREDGFEKRWLFRCGRCKGVLGYELDKSQIVAAESSAIASSSVKHVFLLPGALVGSSDLLEKVFTEQEVSLS